MYVYYSVEILSLWFTFHNIEIWEHNRMTILIPSLKPSIICYLLRNKLVYRLTRIPFVLQILFYVGFLRCIMVLVVRGKDVRPKAMIQHNKFYICTQWGSSDVKDSATDQPTPVTPACCKKTFRLSPRLNKITPFTSIL